MSIEDSCFYIISSETRDTYPLMFLFFSQYSYLNLFRAAKPLRTQL